MSQLELLERRLSREQKARQQAEQILEERSWQLYQANEQLAQQVKTKGDELLQSEDRYRLLIESVQDIIYKITPDGYFTFINSIVEHYLGYTESELIGAHFLKLVRTDYRRTVIQFYRTVLRDKQPSSYTEFPVCTKDGRTVWIGQTVRLVNRQNGLELVAVARDVSQRKLAEDAFLTLQARLASLISNMHTSVLVEDEKRKIILVNQLYCDQFGINATPDALVGQDYNQVGRPPARLFTDEAGFLHWMDQVVNQQQAWLDEVISLRDGRFLKLDFIPIWLEGQYRGHLWQYTDITEKYQAEELIRKSEEKYRGIMNTMELGVLEVDNNNVIRQAYDQFCRMVGYTADELVGRSAPDLLLTEPSRALIKDQQKPSAGAASSHELQLNRKDGAIVWALVSGASILDEGGNVTGAMVIHYDITARKQLEQELAQAKQIAETARYTEKQFLANMSHEIRTPLNAILGFSNLLEMTTLDDQQQESVRFIRTAGKNLLTIVNDILDISKIEAGMLSLESIPFSLSSLADSIRTMLQPAAADKHLRLVVQTDPGLPAVVLGDPTRLTQILLNLLSNALKFTKQGQVVCGIEPMGQTQQAVRVRFTIRDTGIGMAPDVLPFIFERFRQASDFTTRYYGGTGLGLNIVKSLTEMQGGCIQVASTVGEGSCFTLEIPYLVASDSLELAVDQTALGGTPTGQSVKILVVEDNLMNQKLALQVLSRLGCSAQLAENGQVALELLQATTYDLVLMDIQMPVMDGYTTTRHIRNRLNNPVPIIAMTAHALASEREQCLQAGMNDFLPKPFQIEELQRIIRRYTPTAAPQADTLPPSLLKAAACFTIEPLLAALGNDTRFAADVLSLFLEQTPVEINQLRAALANQDLATLRGLLHTQKVPIQLFGLEEATRLNKELEALMSAGQDKTQVEPLIHKYVHLLERELPVIRQALETVIS